MSLKKMLMLSTVATSAVVGLSTGASAQTTVYGNGASLPAPYFRQAADCYSEDTPLIFAGSGANEATFATPPIPFFEYTGTPAQNCATTDYVENQLLVYASTGSGGGIYAYYSHYPVRTGDIDPTQTGVQSFPTINYALSETALSQGNINVYNNGGVIPGRPDAPAGRVAAAGAATATTGPYPNPQYNYGNAIQFPILIAPVTIAYDPVYKKVRQADNSITSYSWVGGYNRQDGSGPGLRLTQNLVCRIFNGQVTNWNDAELGRANRGITAMKDPSDTDPLSVPMQIVGREDSSGTTSLWTRFLAAACLGKPGNAYATSTSRLPGTYTDSTGASQATGTTDLIGAVWNKASPRNSGPQAIYYPGNQAEEIGKYTLANGNDGVAAYIDFERSPTTNPGARLVQGRIGYVGPDFVKPAVDFTGANNFGLVTFDVQNANGLYRSPTSATASYAFGDLDPPESDDNGNFAPLAACSSTEEATRLAARCRNQPADWVEAADPSSVLANPEINAAYPIVGTTNMLLYTCYAQAGSANVLKGFVNFYFGSKTIADPSLGLLASSGFSAMPASWRKAIRESFTLASAPAAVRNLNLQVSTVGSGTQCPATGDFGAPIGG